MECGDDRPSPAHSPHNPRALRRRRPQTAPEPRAWPGHGGRMSGCGVAGLGRCRARRAAQRRPLKEPKRNRESRTERCGRPTDPAPPPVPPSPADTPPEPRAPLAGGRAGRHSLKPARPGIRPRRRAQERTPLTRSGSPHKKANSDQEQQGRAHPHSPHHCSTAGCRRHRSAARNEDRQDKASGAVWAERDTHADQSRAERAGLHFANPRPWSARPR